MNMRNDYESAHPLFDRPAQAPAAPAVPLNPTVESWDAQRLAPVNSSVPQDDAARIRNQQDAILARMLQGPATGPELLRIAARYSARLGELRDAGRIKGWFKRPIGNGQFEYRLI